MKAISIEEVRNIKDYFGTIIDDARTENVMVIYLQEGDVIKFHAAGEGSIKNVAALELMKQHVIESLLSKAIDIMPMAAENEPQRSCEKCANGRVLDTGTATPIYIVECSAYTVIGDKLQVPSHRWSKAAHNCRRWELQEV